VPLPSTQALSAVRDLRGRLARRFGKRLREMRLFGSHARGDYEPDSDVDVLVVINGLEPSERSEVFHLAWECFEAHELLLAPLALSTSEWAELQARELLIAREVERDGVAV
jgi:predicted nucleotidyltransferase